MKQLKSPKGKPVSLFAICMVDIMYPPDGLPGATSAASTPVMPTRMLSSHGPGELHIALLM